MKTNPFKFGTVVDDEFFTDRRDELERISSFLHSKNHLVLISPRRYGKTSLIKKAIIESGRPSVYLDLQLVFSIEDFAAQLLKRIYRIYPVQKLKNLIKGFSIIPVVNINPVTGQTEIFFKTGGEKMAPLEDVLDLAEKISTEKKKLIIVLDEFQEIFGIDKDIDRVLRSVIQMHKNLNYIFLGSNESMLREIFEKKSSPFYRFGSLMTLNKIPVKEFTDFIAGKFNEITEHNDSIAKEIIGISESHPYYTQRLASEVWECLVRSGYKGDIVNEASVNITLSHDNDYERLWNTLNRTDMIILTGIATADVSPLSAEFSRTFNTGAPTTVYSALQRLVRKGLLVKEGTAYIIDDPFFKRWILYRRQI